MRAQEEERTWIAGELHDGVMQQILALSLVLGTGKRQPDAEAKKTVADVQCKLIEVGKEVRQLSHNLHPHAERREAAGGARGYCEEFSCVRNVAVTCHVEDSVQDLSRGAAVALYRIAQEAMGNAVTHGGGTARGRSPGALERARGSHGDPTTGRVSMRIESVACAAWD